MVIDLKVLVRSFNSESRACYVGNPGESFFRVSESNMFIREEWPFPDKGILINNHNIYYMILLIIINGKPYVHI
jgi:hypothetical protein